VHLRRFDFVYLSPGGDLGTPSADIGMLGGNSPSILFTTIEDGAARDLFLDPIPGELFERMLRNLLHFRAHPCSSLHSRVYESFT
jgi:hypothetical protein